MADGVEIRAQIDTETVRSLLVINGGVAAGLAALMSPALENPKLRSLAIGMLIAIAVSGIGLFFATLHNRCRRKCNLEYEKGAERGRACTLPTFLSFLQSVPGEPCICTRSIVYMWTSLACFLISLLAVITGAWLTLAD